MSVVFSVYVRSPCPFFQLITTRYIGATVSEARWVHYYSYHSQVLLCGKDIRPRIFIESCSSKFGKFALLFVFRMHDFAMFLGKHTDKTGADGKMLYR